VLKVASHNLGSNQVLSLLQLPGGATMSDRTMLAIGRTNVSVPKLAKRAVQALTVTGIAAIVSLAIIAANGLLMGKAAPLQAYYTWYNFITRPDIISTSLLTAIVAISYAAWQRDSSGGKR
jgi:hypothetical protein